MAYTKGTACTISKRKFYPLGPIGLEIITGSLATSEDTLNTQFITKPLCAFMFPTIAVTNATVAMAADHVVETTDTTQDPTLYAMCSTQAPMTFVLFVFGY